MDLTAARHHVKQGETAARPKYPMDLSIKPVAIRNVHCDVLHPHEIVSAAVCGQIQRVPNPEFGPVDEPTALRQICGGVNKVGTEVDA